MSTVIVEDQPEPQPRIKRTTIIEQEQPAPAETVVVNAEPGTSVVIEDDED